MRWSSPNKPRLDAKLGFFTALSCGEVRPEADSSRLEVKLQNYSLEEV